MDLDTILVIVFLLLAMWATTRMRHHAHNAVTAADAAGFMCGVMYAMDRIHRNVDPERLMQMALDEAKVDNFASEEILRQLFESPSGLFAAVKVEFEEKR